ncbi:hypothetical protein PR048_008686 [Dryococelus australis]|uniref:Uncharacterized protein n=1 Tax=Dryococelus australis TaxID=614101 RepID=A0ABQ9HXT8_9NEOP|nr:hypothetical protein PR048_008686 [Dryococelus australis]
MTFAGRWIGRDSPTAWPPRSLEITQLNFFNICATYKYYQKLMCGAGQRVARDKPPVEDEARVSSHRDIRDRQPAVNVSSWRKMSYPTVVGASRFHPTFF